MEPRSSTQLRINLSDHNDPEDVIDALFLEAFAAGTYRRARSLHLPRVRPRASLLPPGVRPLRAVVTGTAGAALARGDGWLLRSRRWRGGSAHVSVLARSNALAERVLTAATRGAEQPPTIDPHRVAIGFWHRAARGPSRSERTMAVEPWPEIRRNYTAAAAAAGDRLMAQRPGTLTGRLLLLHGPPGTGKTTMLRALAIAWRRWCHVDCVLDPERLFGDPSYLLSVGLGDEDEGGSDTVDGGRWRLLVLEDCDELIRAGAKDATGQGLGAPPQSHRRAARPGSAAAGGHHHQRAVVGAPPGGHASGSVHRPDRGRQAGRGRRPPGGWASRGLSRTGAPRWPN